MFSIYSLISCVLPFAVLRRYAALTLVALVALSLAACSVPKRGESELEYKNRLAKYTIAGVLFGGYYGIYHAKTTGVLPLHKVINFSGDGRTNAYLALFYSALGGYTGYSLVEYEGEIKRTLNQMQQLLGSTTQMALNASEINKPHLWSFPDEQAKGTIMVVDRYQGSQGYTCQDLVTTINAIDVNGDVNEAVRQTACQLPSGHWELWTHGVIQEG